MTTTDDQFRLALKSMVDDLVEKMNQPGAVEATERALFGDTPVDRLATEEALREMTRIVQEMELYDLEGNPLAKHPKDK